MTISHLTNPAAEELLAGHPKDAGQVIGYSYSTKQANDACQVAGYGRAPLRAQLTSERFLYPAGIAQ
jgi:hypothetical protein